MNGARYYRINYAEALAAWDAYEKTAEQLEADCRAFAENFTGATPIFSFSVHGQRFHGLRFTPIIDSPLWTIAAKREGYVQRPRSALPKSFKGDRKAAANELKGLWTDWACKMPDSIVGQGPDLDGLWSALGTHWGDLLFNGIKRFRRGGCIYVCTGASLDPRAQEITGGEYLKAEGGAA